MSTLNVRTDGKWHHFKYGYEVPKRVMKREFDWLRDGEESDGFIHYKGTWYHLSQFMRLDGNGPLKKQGWQAAHGDSFFSGVVIRVSNDGEQYKIGTYTE